MNRRGFLRLLGSACAAAITACSLVPLARAFRAKAVSYVGTDPRDLPGADHYYPMTYAGLNDALRHARAGDVVVVEPYARHGNAINTAMSIAIPLGASIQSLDYYEGKITW